MYRVRYVSDVEAKGTTDMTSSNTIADMLSMAAKEAANEIARLAFGRVAAYAAWKALHPMATMDERSAFLRAYDAEMG